MHDWDIGWEHFYEGGTTKKRFFSLGFALSPWQTVPYTEYESIGKFEGDRFDPENLEAANANAGLHGDACGRCVLGGAAGDGLHRRSDPRRRAHRPVQRSRRGGASGVGADQAARQDRAHLSSRDQPDRRSRLEGDGTLTFDNAAVRAGFAEAPTRYRAVWSRFDNAAGTSQRIAETESTTTSMTAPRDLPTAAGSFIEVDISAESAAHPSWREPVRRVLPSRGFGWTLVGLERMP